MIQRISLSNVITLLMCVRKFNKKIVKNVASGDVLTTNQLHCLAQGAITPGNISTTRDRRLRTKAALRQDTGYMVEKNYHIGGYLMP